MGLFVYVDNSNVWIEGCRLSAVAKGMAPNLFAAMNDDIVDMSWSYDFGRLYELACPPGELIGRSALFGSRPPPNDSLWQRARDEGFEVITYERNASNREKKIDVDIAVTMTEDSFLYMKSERDTVVLVAGDADYVPAVEKLQHRGFKVQCLFWGQASRELRELCDDFINLDSHLDYLAR